MYAAIKDILQLWFYKRLLLIEQQMRIFQNCSMVINNYIYRLNKVFVAARKHNTERNKTGFILYACDSHPLNSRVKNKTIF